MWKENRIQFQALVGMGRTFMSYSYKKRRIV
jgi:hypothetical protein